MNFPLTKIGGTTGIFLSDKKDCNIDQYDLIGVEQFFISRFQP